MGEGGGHGGHVTGGDSPDGYHHRSWPDGEPWPDRSSSSSDGAEILFALLVMALTVGSFVLLYWWLCHEVGMWTLLIVFGGPVVLLSLVALMDWAGTAASTWRTCRRRRRRGSHVVQHVYSCW